MLLVGCATEPEYINGVRRTPQNDYIHAWAVATKRTNDQIAERGEKGGFHEIQDPYEPSRIWPNDLMIRLENSGFLQDGYNRFNKTWCPLKDRHIKELEIELKKYNLINRNVEEIKGERFEYNRWARRIIWRFRREC